MIEKYSDRVIYVGNLDKSVTSGDLMLLFSSVGHVLNVGLYLDLGYGFVEFSHEKYVDRAIASFNRQKYFNRVLRVEKTVFYKQKKEFKHGRFRSVEGKKKNYRFF